MAFILLTGGFIISIVAGFYFQKALKKKEIMNVIIFLIFGAISIWMIFYSRRFLVIPDYTIWILIGIMVLNFVYPRQIRIKKGD